MGLLLDATQLLKYDQLKAKSKLTSVNYLSLMNPMLYLLSTLCAHSCIFQHNRWLWLWGLSWWVLGLCSTSWRPCDMESTRELSLLFRCVIMTLWYYSSYIKHLWWYYCNLSAYVCDWSLGAHKNLHSILSLKLGVTNWYQSQVDCRTQA